MSVFDKELNINGKAVRSPEQQVWKNMKDIEKLQEVIKPEYTTSASLTSSSVSVAIASTNAPDGTTEGWLLTNDGLKFKITGGDETNLLLEYYADLKGPQGEQGESGAEVQIDDSGTSATKVWSSQKTSNKIDLISDKGIYYTEVQPTLSDGVYSLNVSDLGNNNTYTWQKYGDLIIYIDGDGNPTELWKCVGLNGTHDIMTVEKIADYAKGEKLYHNIVGVANLNWTAGEYRNLHVVFDLYLPFKFTDANSFVSWINGLTEDTPVFGIGQGWSSGWTSVVTMLKPSGQANRVKFDMMSFNHSSLVTDTNIITTNNLSDQTIIIKN